MKRSLGTIAERTVPEKILLAALHLEEAGQSPFSAEALIVAAWHKYPRTFGLKGYVDQYPDSNKVLSSIMGVRGLTGRGWLAKVSQKLYALSREGRHVVRRLEQGDDLPIRRPVLTPMTPHLEDFLHSSWRTAAVEKYLQGRKQEITFPEACEFWGIGDAVRGPAVKARLDEVRTLLSTLEKLLVNGEATTTSGRSVSLADVNTLDDVHLYLDERFSRHLTLLRSRAGRG